MKDIMIWFVHLVRKDIELFEVDVGEEETLFKKIMKELNKIRMNLF